MTFRTCRRHRKPRQGSFFGVALPRARRWRSFGFSGNLIPNQAMLINSIPLLEAQASSEIENIVTTADRLFRYANDAASRARPCHQGSSALPHRLAPRFRDAGAAAGFDRHGRRGLSNDQGGGTRHSHHAGNGVGERCNRRGHLHAAGGRGRSPEQARQLGALHSRGRGDRPADPPCGHALSVPRRSTRSSTETGGPDGC